MTTTFRSRISVALLLFILVMFTPILFLTKGNVGSGELVAAIATIAGSLAIVLLLLLGMRYEVSDSTLSIKLGPVNYGKIPLSEITSVKRSYNPLSSPASSLKRLLVKSKSKSVLISPAQEKEFIQLLKTRNPQIKVVVNDKNDWWRFWDWDI
ncbi:MAG: PH domain-containing protein [Flavobacteriales bacterium]|nr:PH domain-containing protein [Flavobacteriales bacterium]